MASLAPDPKTANRRYHDAAARTYEGKWSISFDERCVAYVRGRAERMLPRSRYGRVLEVGCGTGFFLLNLWQAGYVEEPHACDISSGMLEVCRENATRLGCDLRLRVADAEVLPFSDATFELVVGHAILHHLPHPRAALREIHRVLVPGGAVLIAGEPTRVGHRLARASSGAAWRAFRLAARVRPALRREPAPPTSEDERTLRELEFAVDLHTFDPEEVAGWARAEGFRAVRVETEEFLSSLFGWAVRALEADAAPGLLGERWARWAYRTYLRLYRFDRRWAARVVPRRAFHNLLLYAERPDG